MTTGWRILEFQDQNPQLNPMQVMAHFEKELEIDKQFLYAKQENESILELRELLKPQYVKKFELEEKMKSLDLTFEMKIFMKYPKNKGTDKERKAYRLQLQQENEAYSAYQKQFDDYKASIKELEEEMKDVENRAKNARSILQTFSIYQQALLNSMLQSVPSNATGVNNGNAF